MCPHTAPSSPRRFGCPHLTCLDEPCASAATYARSQLTRRNLFFLQRGATYMKEPKFTTPWSQVHGGAGTSSAGAAVGEEPGPGAPDGPHTPLRLPPAVNERCSGHGRAERTRGDQAGEPTGMARLAARYVTDEVQHAGHNAATGSPVPH